MSAFEPLLDDLPARRASVRNDQSDYFRNSPLIAAQESVATTDRGGGALDQDLGRALLSTPRLVTSGAQKWKDNDPDEVRALDIPAKEVDEEFVEGYKNRAMNAIRAGQKSGGHAEAIRGKMAEIKGRHWGGFLNYKNWGWVRRMRERKLRAMVRAAYPASKSALSQAAPVVDSGPQISAPQIAPPDLPEPQMPVQENSAVGESLDPFEREAQASLPFSPGGAFFGKGNVSAIRDGKPKATGIASAAPTAFSQNLMFGVQPVSSPQAVAAGDRYAEAMKESMKIESAERRRAGDRVLDDQGSLAMPQLARHMKGFRTAFHNGYWDAEKANPTPTRQAATKKTVRFADSSTDDRADLPDMASRDPGRTFAVEIAKDLERKTQRRAALNTRVADFREQHLPVWEDIRSSGARWHQGISPFAVREAQKAGLSSQEAVADESESGKEIPVQSNGSSLIEEES